MKILVVMSDNRPIQTDLENAEYNSLTAAINYNYCKINGYDFIYYQPYYKEIDLSSPYNCVHFHTGNVRSTSWSKLLSVYLTMDMGYDYIVYIDTDAILKTMNYKIEDFIQKYDNDFIFFDDSPNLRLNISNTACAGFFIVKVSERTKSNIKEWYNNTTYPQFDVTPFYEQTILNFCLSEKINMTIVPEIHFEEEPGQLVRHMHSGIMGLRWDYFIQYMKSHNIELSINSNINVISFDVTQLSNLFI